MDIAFLVVAAMQLLRPNSIAVKAINNKDDEKQLFNKMCQITLYMTVYTAPLPLTKSVTTGIIPKNGIRDK